MGLKKRFIYIVLTLLFVLSSVTSCGESGKEEGEQEPQHTHVFGEWELRKVAGCDEPGRETRYCDCGERETREIPLIPHTWVEATTEAPKTCTKCGLTEGEALVKPNVNKNDTPFVTWK